MSRYITRIELQKPLWDDYINLHKKMEAKGFVTSIKGSNGNNYQLPVAEYFLESDATLQDVFNMANDIAKTMDKPFGIISTECLQSTWEGLGMV